VNLKASIKPHWPLRCRKAGALAKATDAAALAAFAIAAAICNGATPTQDTTEPIWPTKEWQGGGISGVRVGTYRLSKQF
jgi:hypothetical protein